MATLNGGIGANDELIRISGTAPAPGTYFTIGSEAFKANGVTRGPQGRNFTRDYLAVDRGVAGTTKATHSTGATLTPYYPDAPAVEGHVIATDGTTTVDPATQIVFPAGTLTSPGAGVATVTLIPTLLGPFPIAFDDTNIDNGDVGVILTPLDAGTLVIRAWLEVTAPWDYVGGASAAFHVIVAPDSDPTDGLDVATYITASLDVQGDIHIIGEASAATRFNATARMIEVGHLAAWCGLAPTNGAGNIYAIIATPTA